MTSDLALLGFTVAACILAFVGPGIWLGRCMGAILVCGGGYLGLIALRRLRQTPTKSPRDGEGIIRHYQVLRGTHRPGYETLGRFEVPDAHRIIDRLDEEHIPFKIDAPFEIRPIPTTGYGRHWLYIYVRPEFKKRADEIVLEGSQL